MHLQNIGVCHKVFRSKYHNRQICVLWSGFDRLRNGSGDDFCELDFVEDYEFPDQLSEYQPIRQQCRNKHLAHTRKLPSNLGRQGR